MSSIEWRDSKKPYIKFCGQDDFLEAQDIDQTIRDSYMAYINTTKPTDLKKNKAGFYICEWKVEDQKNKFTYQATYDDQYLWGIMRTPLREDTKERTEKLVRIEKLLVKLCEFHKISVE